MPDHVHVLVSGMTGKSVLDVGSCYKRMLTVRLRNLGYRRPVWQRRFYDRGIRTDWNNDVNAAVCYVLNNPVRKNLVTDYREWPYMFVDPSLHFEE